MGNVMNFEHREFTDQLSDYLDDELSASERAAIDAHLAGCAQCAAVLADLKRVVARAKGLEARPPQTDLWAGIAARIEAESAGRIVPRRRVSFTLPQLAAAAVILIAMSAGIAWQTAERMAGDSVDRSAEASRASSSNPASAPSVAQEASAERSTATADDVQMATVSVADPQYDAAVADLENALKQGRGRLDGNTIAIVEHNLQIIDQAIEQARQALAGDPANSYLSSHLFEARRRKLDLLRRAAALSTESD